MNTVGPTKAVRKDVARNRALLVEAARVVFAERGLDATLDDIAKHAGVGTGTAYRHFANKQEIAAEVLAAASESIVAEAQDALLVDDPWEALAGFFESMSARMAVDRGLHETLVLERGPSVPVPLRASLIEAITALFARAKAAGVIRADAEATDAAPIIAMMAVAFDMSAVSSPDLWRRYLALYLDGLRATDRPPLPAPPLTLDHLSVAMAAGKRHG